MAALTTFSVNAAGAVLNVSNAESLVSANAAIVGNLNGSSWTIRTIGSLAGAGFSAFAVRVGPNGTAADNLVVQLQNNIVSVATAQTDINNWSNTNSGQPGYVYLANPNTTLYKPTPTGINGVLLVTLTNVNAASNLGLVSVYNTGAANPADPTAQAAGLLGSNTVNLGAALLSVTGLIAAPVTVTFNQANVVALNGNTMNTVSNVNSINAAGIALASGFTVVAGANVNGVITLSRVDAVV